MRLSSEERSWIRKLGLKHFGVVPLIFGSRLDDDQFGGDIDIFIPGDWETKNRVTKRLAFCAELKNKIGDQKIDVVFQQPQDTPLQREAIRVGMEA